MSKSKDSCETTILKYLTEQNRPYSVNDIVQNMHKEHGKTAVQKALDNLVQNGKVREKAYGKQKVYLVDQEQFAVVSADELKTMDDKLEQLEKELKHNQDEYKEAQAQLKMTNSSMTTEEARKLVSKLKVETEELEAKYKSLSENQGEVMDKKERMKIRNKRDTAVKHWRVRKKMCMGIVNAVLDNCEMKKPTLMEAMGIETDEDCEITMPA